MLCRRWQQAIAAVQDATLEPSGWDIAIAQVVSLCGGRVGHLLTVGGPDWLQTNVFTGAPDGAIDHLLQNGVADPAINPRVRQVLLQDTLRCQNDLQILKPGDRERNPLYRELDRLDTGHGTWTMILREGSMNVALAMGSEVSKAEQNPHDEAAFMLFADIIQRSVRLQVAVQSAVDKSYCDALDMLSVPAFLVGASGHLFRSNASGDAILRRGSPFGFRQGRLMCANAVDAARFSAAVEQVHSGVSIGAVTVALGSVETGVMLLDLVVVRPTAYSIVQRRQVLIVVRAAKPDRVMASAEALAVPYNLTPAETAVATMLALALTPEQIAMARRVSLGTVRSQISALHLKLGVQKSVDLLRLIEGFGSSDEGRSLAV